MTTAREVRHEDGQVPSRSPLASNSITGHLLRGATGLTAAVFAIVLLSRVGPVSLALLPISALAWRGCPTCWTVGLFGTLTDVRARGCLACRDASSQTGD